MFSDRSQMTSKCGKNKKMAHEAIGECATATLNPGSLSSPPLSSTVDKGGEEREPEFEVAVTDVLTTF